MKARIANLLKRSYEFGSSNDTTNMIENLIQEAFSKGQFNVLSERDFKHLIFNEDYIALIYLFYNRSFFQENPFLIANTEIITIINKCNQNDKFFCLLEMLKYHRHFIDHKSQMKMQFIEKEAVSDFLHSRVGKPANYDALSLYYHLMHLSRGNVMKNVQIDEIMNHYAKLVWGPSHSQKHREIFNVNLSDLLFVSFKGKLNKHLQFFLADCFFGAENYIKALTTLTLTFMILSRLENKQNNLNDILHIYFNTFGEQKFAFYLQNHLPKVLSTYASKVNLTLYNQALRLYQMEKAKPQEQQSFAFHAKTFFDEHFIKSNSKIFYSWSDVGRTERISYSTQSFNILPQSTPIHQQQLQSGQQQTTPLQLQGKNQQQGVQHQNTPSTMLSEYKQAFINNDRQKMLQIIRKELSFHSELEIKYKENQKMQQIENKNNQNSEFDSEHFNNLLISKIYPLVNNYSNEENNIKKYLKKKGLPSHAGPKFLYSTLQNKRARSSTQQGLEESYQSNMEVQSLVTGLRHRFASFSEGGNGGNQKTNSNNNSNQSKDALEDDIGISEQMEENLGGDVIIKNGSLINNSSGQMQDSHHSQQQQKSFKEYIQKVKLLEEEQKKKQTTFMSKEELQKLKKLIKDDEKQPTAQQLRERHSIHFQKVHRLTEKDILNQQQLHSSTQSGGQQQTNIVGVSQEYFQKLLEHQKTEEEIILRLEKEFMQLTETAARPIINGMIHMNPLLNENIGNGNLLLFKIFTQPLLFTKTDTKSPVTQNQQLKLALKTQKLGTITKDYNKYLDKTVFPYPLSEAGYNSLLSLMEQNYKRLWFKRTITHMLYYSQQIFDSNIELICKICKEQKIGVTLLEFAFLIANRKILISEKAFATIVIGLKDFKDVNEEIESLCKEFMTVFHWDITFAMVDTYITSLIKQRKSEKYMVFLEHMRDAIMAQKAQFNNALSSQENAQLQDKQRQKNRLAVQNLFRAYVKKLIECTAYKMIKPIFDELVTMRFALSEEDYIGGFFSVKENPNDVQVMFERMKHDPHQIKITTKTLECLFSIIEDQNKGLGDFYELLLKEYFYSNKIPFTVRMVNQCILIFSRTKSYTSFGNFLKHLIQNEVKANENTKILCYRLLHNSKEEMSKGYLKGLIEQLLSKELQERAKLRIQEERKNKKLNLKKQQEEQIQQAKTPEKKPEEESKKDVAKKPQAAPQQQQEKGQQSPKKEKPKSDASAQQQSKPSAAAASKPQTEKQPTLEKKEGQEPKQEATDATATKKKEEKQQKKEEKAQKKEEKAQKKELKKKGGAKEESKQQSAAEEEEQGGKKEEKVKKDKKQQQEKQQQQDIIQDPSGLPQFFSNLLKNNEKKIQKVMSQKDKRKIIRGEGLNKYESTTQYLQGEKKEAVAEQKKE